ncbi:hypothetical protein Q7C36_022741 [Tachysurus vachellii]|uniref:Uncharacterized protein n=1 Tax=Tachysurus vachellii TaxID=175792 RepID=A0AA88IM23_TACVA|nr:hypothetical protein Q7C36_022741 [Tachysurus vachellii]
MEDISQASVQSDSSRDALFETPASDSDSGDSLFVTQSVSSALRNVKRHRPSNTQACPFSQESEDKQETVQHEKNGTRSDSDSETSYADLLHRWRKLSRINSSRPHRRPRSRRVALKRKVLPFLKKSDSGKLSVHGNQTIVNSELGGFFKCILKLNKGCKKNRRELSPSRLPSEWEQNHEDNEDDDDDDDEDIRKVNTDFFIYGGHKKIRQTWLPFLKWKTIQDPRKCTKKSKKCQEEWEKSYQTRQVAEDPMEPQDDTDVHNENSLFNIEESQSRRMGDGSSKFPASPSLSPGSTPSCLSPEKSLFVQNLFMDPKEEHTENSPQVLVTCSQSQSVDWHQAPKIDKTFENWMEPIDDEMDIEETQWPCLADHDEDETQISEDNPMDRDRWDNVLCLENISSYDLQGQSKDICEGVHHDTVDNEDLVSASGGFFSSQDLFQEPNNQASPLKETDVENANEKMKNCVLLHDDTDSLMKNKRCSSILADVEGDDVKYSKSLPSIDGDIDQGRKEKNKKTSDNSVERVYPSMPLEDYTTGTRGSNYSSPSKDFLMVRQKEKTESPLFKYGGITFLKRKKGKVPEISHNLSLIQVDPGQNEDPVPHFNDVVKQKKRKKLKNVGLLEEPVNTLPEISVSTESCLSVQDSSVVCASVSGSKPKKKRKKDKNVGLLDDPVGTPQEISVSADLGLSVQDCSVVCPSVGVSNPKKKRKKYKNVGLLEEPVGTLQEMSVSADPSLSVQDSSVVCASVSGSKPKKKRKKDKNVELLEEPVGTLQEISVSTDLGLSVHDSSVVCASVGGSKPKKKRKKDKNVELLEEPVGTLQEISVSADLGLSVHDSSVVCASVGGSKPKKKRKKDKNVGLLEEPVGTLQEISLSADLGLSVHDSSVVCASVSGSKPKKKRKKDKNVELLQEPVGTLQEMSVSADPSLSVQDCSVVCASVSGSKPKKKRKKDKNVGLLDDPVVTPQEISVSADLGLSVQDCSVVCASVGVSKPKKKRKKDKNVELLEEPVGTLQEISLSADLGLSVHDSSVVCASIPCQGSAYLVSISKETELLTGNDLFMPEVNQLDIGAQAHKDHVQCEGHEPRRKKKRETKKRDTSPVISDEVVAPKSSKESHLNHCTKAVKKKKQKFIYDVGEGQVAEMYADSQNLGGPFKKILKMPAGIEIQPVNNIELMTDETVTPKKKKRKRQEVVREENVDVEASFVETIEQVETLDTYQDSVQQAAEVVQVKKQKKKKDRTVTCHEEEVFKNSTVSLRLGDTTTSKTPNNKPETGGIDEEEGLGESEPVKKKKKKRKELDSDGSCLVSHALEYLNNTCWLNNEQTNVVKEASRSGQKLCKEHPAPCLNMQLTNDENKKKKSERTKGDDSESTQQVLLSDDTIQLNGKKKKKKKKDG